jgi:hypothetical protein
MRLMKLSKWLVLGGAAATAALLLRPRRGSATAPTANEPNVFPRADVEIDPDDPVQGFDEASELRVEPLDFDAQSDADVEAGQDLASFETDLDQASLDLDTPAETDLDARIAAEAGHGTGELYGVHTPPAVDRDLPDDREAMDQGENWLEALQESATEHGAAPEREIDVVDEVDEPPHPSDDRDIPVADRGSAGPGGL